MYRIALFVCFSQLMTASAFAIDKHIDGSINISNDDIKHHITPTAPHALSDLSSTPSPTPSLPPNSESNITTDIPKTAPFHHNDTNDSENLNDVFMDGLPLDIVQALNKAQIPPEHFSLAIIPLPTQDGHGYLPQTNQLPSTPPPYTTSQHRLTHPISHQTDVPRLPASTMKLIPTFVALDTLGADFTWDTHVYASGLQIGQTLYGNLIIQGSGDPKLTSRQLKQLFSQIQQQGIHHLDGNIILDSSIFRHVTKNPAAFDGDPLRPYNASPDGLLVNFSTLTIHSTSNNGMTASLSYEPNLADYHLPSTIAQKSGRCGNFKYSLAPQWQTQGLVYHTKLPTGCDSQSFFIAYPNAKDFAKKTIKALWLDMGNTLTGDVITQEIPWQPYQHSKTGIYQWQSSPFAIATLPSFPLAEQIYDINHHSNNVMTEQVLLSLPLYANPSSANTHLAHPLFNHHRFSNYDKSTQFVKNWWQNHLTSQPPYLTNGSGLCRQCHLTAHNLSELLSFAYQHPEFKTYLNSLGRAGVSGTIASHAKRMPHSAAINRAWIKTGTLNNVAAMAGYVKGLSGQDYVVVGIINDDKAGIARPILDTMLDWTARH